MDSNDVHAYPSRRRHFVSQLIVDVGGLLIYFKDDISVERATGLQNDVDD
jgi:hypothetical protein